MESAEQEQHEEDMAAMRALLENILSVSFDSRSAYGRITQNHGQ